MIYPNTVNFLTSKYLDNGTVGSVTFMGQSLNDPDLYHTRHLDCIEDASLNVGKRTIRITYDVKLPATIATPNGPKFVYGEYEDHGAIETIYPGDLLSYRLDNETGFYATKHGRV